MSFLKSLFGGGKSKPASGQPAEETTGRLDYKGYLIRAVPFKEGGQYQLSGIIEKTIEGQLRQHRFIRADRSNTSDEVTQLALAKGRTIIDEQGDGIFA